ncbi:MAG TPA: cysteine--tRNA ligase [Smithellaceae bacterium]|jgi:cysteinyl-tRNA synthetase|nr:cysteine--tRNA ligase [Syntrophaceae bacterium]NMC92743.1 cysteine--tRNA ligase [Smithella sp.]HOD62707.1 cysteine--tRNA ligase [Smithellaceae bacterium]MBP9530766.1 cysteine--tRNA ligase [Syntrophaceae bacterium]MBP9650620.1 cysteine--tRNA ligase [Syntrophaceae bacterium]
MMNVYKSIMDRIGNTPLVEISKLNPNKKVTILAKLESANPGGSIKDRTALSMIENAEKRGDLKPGRIILEATSGNTGIGLAMVAAAKGYKLCLTMSEAASEERKKILRAMGAELIFTPAAQGTDGAIEVAYRMLRENPEKYFGTDQFNNPDNVRAHYFGTAQEIWDQTQGRIAAVVVTLGTTGTAMGISQRLKELDCRIQIIGVEPYLQHKIQGLKNMRESYRPGIYDKKRLDEKVNILDEDAFEMSRRLAREEGILAGMSSGAAMFVAAQKARQMEEGTIVVIFPDSGERYLSTELFAVKEELATVSFYNAIKRRKTLFRPLNPKEVRLRTCGPTVHDAPHLGNYRRLVVSDLLCRYLTFKGYAVKHVVDIVDCSDKSLKGSEKAGMNLADYSDKYLRIFLEDVRFLQIRPDNIYVRASEDVDAALKIVEKLVDRGYAYEKLHSVYFDISKLGDYGSLSNIDPAKTRTGRSVDLDDYEKDSPADFALLKRAGLGELKRGIYSKTKWGNVRPGWHLECAAISRKYLGAAYDIHVSGADETFPHCENLIAINKACCGHSGAKYWIGAELILVDGRKMSRSLNNIVTMDDLRQSGHGGRDVRFFLLGMNYRKPISYSVSALQMARNTIKKMDTFISRLQTIRNAAPNFPEVDQLIYDLNHAFERALDDDLNISGALAALFEFIGAVNAPLAGGKISGEDARKILEALQKINDVLQVMDFKKPIDDRQIDELIQKREKARQAGLWQEADLLRNRLAGLGVDVLDSRQGTIWRFK